MATKKSPSATTSTAPKLSPVGEDVQTLIEKLRDVEKYARHAADPREPAAQIAGALADYFAAK